MSSAGPGEAAAIDEPELYFTGGLLRVASARHTGDSSSSSSGKNSRESFLKSFQWCPDGCSALTSSEDGWLQVWQMPDQSLLRATLYYKHLRTAEEGNGDSSSGAARGVLSPSLQVSAGEAVYDCKWLPCASSSDSRSYRFAATSRDLPINLHDATTGVIICSYRGHNHMDELDPATSIAFNPSGERLYAGSNRMIKCFDVSCPRSYSSMPTSSTRRDPLGQKGLLSCLAFSPDASGAYAAGSYGGSIGLYVEDMEGCALELRDVGFGVSCVRWSPDGGLLYAGGRRCDDIVCWDVRHTRRELGRCRRQCSSNQKMSFDLDPWGRALIAGGQDGSLRVYDAGSFELLSCDVGGECANSVAVHPYCALLGVARGQRHFADSSSDSDSEEAGTGRGRQPRRAPESCVELYSFGVK